MVSNRALEAIKRLLTADAYIRSHDQPAQRGTSTAVPENTLESPSVATKEVTPRPEVS